MSARNIDKDILNIDPEECCCPNRRRGVYILSAALEYGRDLGRVDIHEIPKFQFCPWCGMLLSAPAGTEPMPRSFTYLDGTTVGVNETP